MLKTLEKKIIQSSGRMGPVPLLSFEALLKAVSYGYGAGSVLRNKWYGAKRMAWAGITVKHCPVP